MCTRGMILVDIILALSLATFFVAIFSSTIYSAEQSFERAHDLMATSSTNGGDNSLVLVSPFYVPVSDMPVCSADFMGSSSVSTTPAITPVISTISLPISTTIPLTHLEVRNNTAFISTDSAVASDSDLFVIDLGSSSIISSINTGPGIATFSLVGKRIYAAAASAAAQLHVIDFSGTTSPSQPFLENKYKLPLPYATATPPYATAISFDPDSNGSANQSANGRIFLGTEKWDGDEFSTIDVTNPSLPAWLSGLEIGSKVNDIAGYSGIAYIANAGADQLIDTAGGRFSPSGWSRQEGKSVSIYHGRLILGRTSGGYNITTDPELFVLATTSATKDIPGGIYGIVQDDNHVYVITHQVGQEFQIFDPALSTSTVFSLPTQPQSMTCDGDTIYILSHTLPNIYAIKF